jgi:hypothetical protein
VIVWLPTVKYLIGLDGGVTAFGNSGTSRQARLPRSLFRHGPFSGFLLWGRVAAARHR